MESLCAVGVRCVRDYEPGVDAVVAGWHRDFTFDRLTQAFIAVRAGARLIGTNDDPTYPTADGELPGGGAIVTAIAYAAGVEPLYAGKPHAPSAELIFSRLGWSKNPTDAQRRSLIMVGDRPSTDGGMAVTMGAAFALVLSGVTAERDLPVHPSPTSIDADLASLVNRHFG